MKIKFLALALFITALGFLSSCDSSSGSDSETNNQPQETEELSEEALIALKTTQGIAPELQPFLDSFITELVNREIEYNNIDDLDLVFAQLPPNTAGICYIDGQRVEINISFFNDNESLLELVYHELGHCILGMEHRDNSIMQAAGSFPVTAESIEELFTEEFYFQNGVSCCLTKDEAH
ncbi:MAG: hypothetical protein AB8F34_06570 [Akkermansiaceae bacterium]